jgi:hypothetical protein
MDMAHTSLKVTNIQEAGLMAYGMVVEKPLPVMAAGVRMNFDMTCGMGLVPAYTRMAAGTKAALKTTHVMDTAHIQMRPEN